MGDTLPSGDRLKEFFAILTDDDGAWLAWVDSDFVDVTRDGFLLRNARTLVREGAPLAGPPGAALDELLTLAAGSHGDIAAVVQGSTPSSTVRGLYFNGEPLALVGEITGAPEVPSSTTWQVFGALWLNRARTLLVSGAIDNPDVAGTREDALVRLQLDAGGTVSTRNVLLAEGQFIPALAGPVDSLGRSPNSFALNDRGDFVGTVFPAGGPAAILENLDTVLARAGGAAPIAGRTYRSFVASKVAINDFGETAFTALLDGLVRSFCIIKNGQKFVQEGDLLPLQPQPVGADANSLAPIFLANSGDLFWRMWDTGRTQDAFMRNRDVVVQRNLTRVDGQEVIGLPRDEGAFRVSRDGRFFLCRALMRDFVPGHDFFEALLAVDFGLVVPFPGCTGNAARLTKERGDARAGQRLTLALDGAQALGAVPVLFVSRHPAVPGSRCGLPITGGELLVAPSSLIATRIGAPWTGTAAEFGVDIPAQPALVDLELFVQGCFVDSSGTAQRLRLSNGLRLEIGAP